MYCQLEMCGWLGKQKKAEFGGHVAWSVLKCCHSAPDLQMWTSIPSQPVSFLDIIKVYSFFKCFTYWFVVQSLSHVQLFATPWTAACQASLSFAISQSSLKLMFIESVIPSNHLILLSSPSPPSPNISHHQGLFQWVGSLHQVAKVLGL